MTEPVTTWGNIYWPVFLICVSAAFLPVEIYALVTNTANTLSQYAWTGLHVARLVPGSGKVQAAHTAAWLLSQGMYLVMIFWLWRHIWFGEFR